MATRIYAEVRVNTKKVDTLAASTQGIAANVSYETSGVVVQGAKRRSRVRTARMRKGWTRRRVGAGSRQGWRVLNSVPHTIYNEFGTVKMTAQPMLRPSMAEAKGGIPARVKKWIIVGTTNIVTDKNLVVNESEL